LTLSAFEQSLLAEDGDAIWELFHENSKTSRYERHLTYLTYPTNEQIVAAMRRLRRTHPYADFPKVRLPTNFPPATQPLDEILTARTSAREFATKPVDLTLLAKVLCLSYGVTRDNTGTHFTRPFRAVPSAGGLYPLELFVYASRIDGLAPGLYHFDPEEAELDTLALEGDIPHPASLVVQSDLADEAAATVFVSGVFHRSTFKYSDRGYRFVLIEAGHLIQNAALTAAGVGLGATSIGGYFDRDVDRYLGVDGLSESVVCMLHLGHVPSPSAADQKQP